MADNSFDLNFLKDIQKQFGDEKNEGGAGAATTAAPTATPRTRTSSRRGRKSRGSESRGGRGRGSKSGPRSKLNTRRNYAKAASTPATVDAAISRYTGLPKGPKGVAQQQQILANWRDVHQFRFPTLEKLDLLLQKVNVIAPTSKRKVKRRQDMCDCMAENAKINYLTPEHLAALAVCQGQWRSWYWVVCSLYGVIQRQKHGNKAEYGSYTEVVSKVTEKDPMFKHKAEFKELLKTAKIIQRSWQKKVEALRVANQPMLDAMAQIQARIETLAKQFGHGVSFNDVPLLQISALGGGSGGFNAMPAESSADLQPLEAETLDEELEEFEDGQTDD